MLDKISPIRQAQLLMPKATVELNAQDKIVPNGNRIIEITDNKQQTEKSKKVHAMNPSEKVDIKLKKYTP